MLICGVWRPKVRAFARFTPYKRRSVFTNEQSTSIRISHWRGANFRARIRVCIHPLAIRRKRPNAPSRRRRSCSQIHPKHCWHWRNTNTSSCTITMPPEQPFCVSAKCCPAAAKSQRPSAKSRDVRGIGTKRSPITIRLLCSIRAMWNC